MQHRQELHKIVPILTHKQPTYLLQHKVTTAEKSTQLFSSISDIFSRAWQLLTKRSKYTTLTF